MKVLYIAAECKPFSKTGGVGDVAGELPQALLAEGVDVEIVTPWYGSIRLDSAAFEFNGKREPIGILPADLDGVPVTFIKNAAYFEGAYGTPYVNSPVIPFLDDALRFSFFSEACLEVIRRRKPDIVHVNDWVLGYLFGHMQALRLPQKRVLSIHNIGYQGNLPVQAIQGWNIQRLLDHAETGPLFRDPRVEWDNVNPLRLGLELSHQANTVSPSYMQEITRPERPEAFFEGGKGLDTITRRLHEDERLWGILNGFVYRFEPTPQRFEETMQKKAEARREVAGAFAQPDAFLIGFVGRAVEQKFRLLAEEVDGKSVLEHILDIPGVNVAVLATGLPEYESFMRRFEGRPNYSATVAFDRVKAAQISLGSDVFLMPSLFEPCGITQLESMASATPPLVRWTGGLVDTVTSYREPKGTGFGFDGAGRDELLRSLIACVREARAYWQDDPAGYRELQRRGFQQRFTWDRAAREYVRMYERALRRA